MKHAEILAAAMSVAAFAAMADVSVVRDIPYRPGDADPYAAEACRLDVKTPAAATGFPTVVWFHGGGLVNGRRHFIKIDDSIAQVAVGYRLLGTNGLVRGEACIEDAAAAVAWTLRGIAAYGGDPKRVYVSGMSAGGYLTMMVGMAPKYLARHGFKPTDLAGIAPVSGQPTTHVHVRKFAGDPDPQYRPKINDLAPLRWVGKDLPPIISICGQPTMEWPCRSEENKLLVASCVALGHKWARFAELPHCDHGRVLVAGVPYVEMFVKGRMP